MINDLGAKGTSLLLLLFFSLSLRLSFTAFHSGSDEHRWSQVWPFRALEAGSQELCQKVPTQITSGMSS